jgi:hypothetical protein
MDAQGKVIVGLSLIGINLHVTDHRFRQTLNQVFTDYVAAKQAANGGLVRINQFAPISDLGVHRINALKIRLEAYKQSTDKFWNGSEPLKAVKQEMDRVSREQGRPLAEIAAAMRPDGEFSGLRAQFDEALQATPNLPDLKKGMDKALRDYADQFGRSVKELTQCAHIHGDARHDKFKAAIEASGVAMLNAAGPIPALRNSEGALVNRHESSAAAAMHGIVQNASAALSIQTTPLQAVSPSLGNTPSLSPG